MTPTDGDRMFRGCRIVRCEAFVFTPHPSTFLRFAKRVDTFSRPRRHIWVNVSRTAVERVRDVRLRDAEDVIPYMGLVEHNTTA